MSGRRSTPGNVRAVNGADSPALAVKFSESTFSLVDSATIVFQVRGNFDSEEERASVRLFDVRGNELQPGYMISSWRKANDGTISEGFTDFEYYYDDLDQLDGVVRLMHGEGQQILRGQWRIDLTPE